MTLPFGLDRVPIREVGTIKFVVLDDIPEPWRSQFQRQLIGSCCPGVEGFEIGKCAYAEDWSAWCNDDWFGRPGPTSA